MTTARFDLKGTCFPMTPTEEFLARTVVMLLKSHDNAARIEAAIRKRLYLPPEADITPNRIVEAAVLLQEKQRAD